MIRLACVAGLVLSTVAGAECAKGYRPGERLGWKRYEELGNIFHAGIVSGELAATKLAQWNAAIEDEIAPGVLELFTSPRSKVFLGDFNDPEERKTGEYKVLKDDGAGLRVVWQMEKDVAGPGKPGDPRLISAITFWDYDLERGRPRMITGPDAFRARVEITPFAKRGMAGLSYFVDEDATGRIKAVRPGVYIDEAGERLFPNISVWGRTDHCNSCHRHRRNQFTEEYRRLAPKETAGYRDYLRYLRSKGVVEGEVTRVARLLDSPKQTLVPDGLVAALRGRLPHYLKEAVHGDDHAQGK